METTKKVLRISLAGLAALLTAVIIAPQGARAQTPAQIEYDRQQREYWRQQEQQRQEQQRQQQQMNENARRQQEEMRQLNAPTGKSPTPGQGATHLPPDSHREPRPSRKRARRG
jgi:hypothetical protein